MHPCRTAAWQADHNPSRVIGATKHSPLFIPAPRVLEDVKAQALGETPKFPNVATEVMREVRAGPIAALIREYMRPPPMIEEERPHALW